MHCFVSTITRKWRLTPQIYTALLFFGYFMQQITFFINSRHPVSENGDPNVFCFVQHLNARFSTMTHKEIGFITPEGIFLGLKIDDVEGDSTFSNFC